MASFSGGQIGAFCAESFCERILSEANDVCHDGNNGRDQRVSCVTYESRIHTTREMQPKLSGQNVNGTLVQVALGTKLDQL